LVILKFVTILNALKIVGDYLLQGYTLTISRKDNAHFLTANRSEVFQIYYSSPEAFFSKEKPLEFIIDNDPAGKVTGFYFNQGGAKKSAKKL